MLKRTLFFTKPARLYLKNLQLNVSLNDNSEIKSVPIEDLGFIIIENQQISLSIPLIEELVNNNVAIVFCNSLHLPHSLVMPLEANSVQNERFRYQIDASKSLKKNLWKQCIEAKIYNQSKLLEILYINHKDIRALSRQVKSGDPENKEGTAARKYWPRLFGENFYRGRDGKPPNNLLNYGYTILRAAVARSLIGSGLLPTLGIHHKSKYNAYCLADDIMEAYRPFVDRLIYFLNKKSENNAELTTEIKADILNILTHDVIIDKKKRPLMVALSITTASLAKCYLGEQRKLVFGELL